MNSKHIYKSLCYLRNVNLCFLQWQYNVDKEVIPIVIQCAVEEEGKMLKFQKFTVHIL